MKIIKKVDISNWKYNCTCVKCETEMEADKTDIKWLHHSGGGTSMDYQPAYEEYYFFCPVCNEKIHVPEKEMPKLLQVEIQKLNTPKISSSSGYWDR